MSVNYIVITPVRNEQERFPETIASMVAQTIRPQRWIVVDDGSTDGTGVVADRAAQAHSWITVVHRPDRGFRKQGGGVIDAFYDGYALLNNQPSSAALPLRSGERAGVRCSDAPPLSTLNSQPSTPPWDYLAKLDGDLAFAPDYFEKCFARFATDQKLGIGGGKIFYHLGGVLVDDAPGDPPFHVRGATKIYRRAGWDALGGLLRAPGWDTLDELKANMLGWQTYPFKELPVIQLKPTGSADGTWKNWFKNGRANYITGYHPLFMISKCARRFLSPPVGIAAVGLFCGFVSGYLSRLPQVPDLELIRYLRRQQLNRLLFRESLWR